MQSFSQKHGPWLVALAACLLVIGCRPPSLADVVTFGATKPTHTREAKPMKDRSNFNGSTVRYEEGSPISRQDGTVPWGASSWGKYVFITNYDANASGIFQNIADQTLGVFDTETGRYCELDLDPTTATNASVEWVAIPDPDARQTRIFFQGLSGAARNPGETTGYEIGYIAADMDSVDPCSTAPGVGWQVVGYTGADIVAATPSHLPGFCTRHLCSMDGMNALDQNHVVLHKWGDTPDPRCDPQDTFYDPAVECIKEKQSIAVVRIPDAPPSCAACSAPGAPPNCECRPTIVVEDILLTEMYKDPVTNICYGLNPVDRPEVDPPGGAQQNRFVSGYDIKCMVRPTAPDGCAPDVCICPETRDPVVVDPPGGACATSYCEFPFGQTFMGCSSDSECQGYSVGPCAAGLCAGLPALACTSDVQCFVDLGTCTDQCRTQHVGQVCKSDQSIPCATTSNCPDGDQCICRALQGDPKVGAPIREYAFSGGQIVPTSDYFAVDPTRQNGATASLISSDGAVWLAVGGTEVAVFRPLADGSYTFQSDVLGPARSETLTPTGTNILNWPRLAEVDPRRVVVGANNVTQSFRKPILSWVDDPDSQVQLADKMLPGETKFCFDAATSVACDTDNDCPASSNPCNISTNTCTHSSWQSCQSDNDCTRCTQFACLAAQFPKRRSICSPQQTDCTAGGTCRDWTTAEVFKTVVAGGSPPSVWKPAAGRQVGGAVYLQRVSLETAVPDGHTDGGVSVAATDEACLSSPNACRLWLVALRNGQVQFRIRDDGFWSDWHTIPHPGGVTFEGRPGIALGGVWPATVTVRDAQRRVWAVRLSTANTCDAAACTWDNFQLQGQLIAGGGAILADSDVSVVVYQQLPHFFVRSLDGRLYHKPHDLFTINEWNAVGSLLAAGTPSAAVVEANDTLWVAARSAEPGTDLGQIMIAKVDAAPTWERVGDATPGAFGSDPALVSGNDGLLALAARPDDGTTVGEVYGTIKPDGAAAWRDWKRLTTRSASSHAPAATAFGPSVHVFTEYAAQGLRQQVLE